MFARSYLRHLPAPRRLVLAAGAAVAWAALLAFAQASDGLAPADVEFFEKHIRPVFAQQCYECHSESIQAKGGLRLDVALGIRLGGQRGPLIVPGKPEESLLIKALKHDKQGVDGYRPLSMPPGDQLSDEQIAHFEEWIRRGAPDPRVTGPEPPFDPRKIDWKAEGSLWSLQPPKPQTAPQVIDVAWAKNDVDRFVLARLEAAGIKPAGDADKATWLRRVSFDLTGLPPTVGELLDFELDASADARRKVVDRLLASPRFGERWGRHWLDVARYGESTGKERNFVYLQAWRYRDYVIDSYNQDKPYDQFLREQVAGDLLPHANELEKDLHQIATGFLALNPKGINDRNRESFLLEIADEQVESVSRGVMGISVVCARCHDHKYDPVSQADYYALAGIFRSSEPKFGLLNRTRYASVPDHLLALGSNQLTRGVQPPAELLAELKQTSQALQAKNAEANRLRDALPPPAVVSAQAVASAGVTTTIGTDGSATTRSAANPDSEPKSEEERAVVKLEEEIREETKAQEKLRAKIAEALSTTTAIGLVERPDPADIPIRVRGEVDKPGPIVPRGFLTVLKNDKTPQVDPSHSGRLELANWVASADNPLTARVYVNRVWSKLLGVGIVSTVDNFGAQGEAPTHPELLDYLTLKFVADGWSTKQIIREIVLSRVYAIGEVADDRNSTVDVDNKLLWRWNRKRLEAESIRDAVLAIGGNLDLARPFGTPLVEMGTRELGPEADYSVVHRPYQFRSVYLPFLRGRAPEMLAVFDAADPGLTVGKRDVTAGPDQALYLLNSPLSLAEGKLLAERLLASDVGDDLSRVDLAFRVVLGTKPTGAQRVAALESIAEFEKLFASQTGQGSAGQSSASQESAQQAREKARLAAWSNFAQTLFALPEFRYVF